MTDLGIHRGTCDLCAGGPADEECHRETWCDMPRGHDGRCRNADEVLPALATPAPPLDVEAWELLHKVYTVFGERPVEGTDTALVRVPRGWAGRVARILRDRQP